MPRLHRPAPTRTCARAPGATVAWWRPVGLALGLLAGLWAPGAQALPLSASPWAATARALAHATPDPGAPAWHAVDPEEGPADGAPLRCADGHGHDLWACGGDADDDPWVFLASHLATHLAADLGDVHLLSLRGAGPGPGGLPAGPGLSMDDVRDPDLSFTELEAMGSGLALARPTHAGVPEPGTVVLVLAALGLSLLPGLRRWAD